MNKSGLMKQGFIMSFGAGKILLIFVIYSRAEH